MRARIGRLAVVGALALVGLTCRDRSPLGPGLPQPAMLSLAPNVQTVDDGPLFQLTDVIVKVWRLPRSSSAAPIIDTIAPFVNDSVQLSLSVDVIGDNRFQVEIVARTGSDTVYRAVDSVAAHVAGSGGSAPPPSTVDLVYVGADTAIASFAIEPRDTVLTVNEPFTFRGTARKSDNSVVVANIGWVSRSPSLTINRTTGIANATAEFENAWIVATLATGMKDSTRVSATRVVGQVAVSPDTAYLELSQTQQLTATVTATDQTPLPTRPVTWTSLDPLVATVSATGLVTGQALGTARIEGASGGRADTTWVFVGKRRVTSSWARPADITYPAALGAAQLNAAFTSGGSAVAGTATYTPASGTVLNAGVDQRLRVSFTPSDTTYLPTSDSALITVLKGTAVLELSNLNHTYDGTAKSATVLTTPAGLSTVAVTYNGGTSAPTNAGNYAVVASLSNANYQATDANGVLSIAKASQTITFDSLPDRSYGSPPFELVATASSGLPVSFLASGACVVTADSVTLTGEGSCTITARQAGDGNWNAAADVVWTFTVDPTPVATVDVTPDTALVQVGQQTGFSATPKDVSGNPLTGRAILWETSDSSVATIDASGVVTGVAIDTATVFATSEGVTGTAVVIVTAPPSSVDSTRLNTDADTIFAIGGTRQLVARAYFGDAEVAGVFTWSSTNPAVAIVSSFGAVTAMANGLAQIVVTENGGTADTVDIVVEQRLAKITLTPTRLEMFVGDTARLTLTGADALGNPMALPGSPYWDEMSGTFAVDVTSDGLITAEDEGWSTVYAEIAQPTGSYLEARAIVEVVRRVSRVEVTAAATSLDALGQTTTFNAVAYDRGDRPIPGALFRWESVNGSVAPITSIDGATAILRAARNGVTLVRALAEGTAGGLSLSVQQKIAQVSVIPSDVTIDVGGFVALRAIAQDANLNPIPLQSGAIVWSSGDDTAVSVDATSGLAQGLVVSGGVAVTATAAGGAIGAANVAVQPTVPGDLSFAFDSLTVRSGDTTEIEIRLNKQPAQPTTIDLVVSSTNAAFVVPSIAFAVGETRKTVRLAGRFAGIVQAIATDPGRTFDGDTMEVAVRSGIAFEDYPSALNVGDEFVTRLRMSEPAPPGGVYVTFEGTTAPLQITPSPLLIPAGHLVADVVIRGVAAGDATFHPVTSGLKGTDLIVTVYPNVLAMDDPDTLRIIGAGQYEWGSPWDEGGGGCQYECSISTSTGPSPAPSAPAPAGTDTRAARISVPGTTAPTWVDYESDYYCDGELGDGARLNLNSAAYTYQPGEVPAGFCVRIGAPPPVPLELKVQSSDPTVLAVQENVSIREYYNSTAFAVHGRRPGDVTVTASASGWTPASVPVRVTTPYLWFDDYGEGEIPDTIVISSDQYQPYLYFSVGDSLYRQHPRVDALFVRLSSSDPSVFRLDTAVLLGAGESTDYTYLELVPVNPGLAWLRLGAEGHVGDSVPVRVPSMKTEAVDVEVGAGFTFTAYLGAAIQPADSVFLSVTPIGGADSSIVAADTGDWLRRSYGYVQVGIRGYAVGSRQFEVSAAGYEPDTMTVTVLQPRIIGYDGGVTAGMANAVGFYLGTTNYYPQSPRDSIVVRFNRLSGSSATFVDSLIIYPGLLYPQLDYQGVTPGVDSIEITAPGFTPDTISLTIFREKLRVTYRYCPFACSWYDWYGGDQVGYKIRRIGGTSGYPIQVFVSSNGNDPLINSDSSVIFLTSTNGRAWGYSPVGAQMDSVARLVRTVGNFTTQDFGFYGNELGVDTLIVTDSSGRFDPDTLIVQVVNSETDAGFDGWYGEFTVDIQANPTVTPTGYVRVPGTNLSPEVPDTITVEIISSDPTIFSVRQRFVRTAPPSSQFTYTMDFNAPGIAYLIVRDSAQRPQILRDSVRIVASGPRMMFNYTSYSLGTHQRSWSGDVWLQMPTTDSVSRWVHLRSSAPNVVTVSDSVEVPRDQYYAYFDIVSRDTIGVVQIEATSPGHAPSFMEVEVSRPRLEVYAYDWGETTSPPQPITIALTDRYGAARATTRPVTVLLSTLDTLVARSDSAQVTIDSGMANSSAAYLHYTGRGRTRLIASDPTAPGLTSYEPADVDIEVDYPSMTTTPYYSQIGLVTSHRVRLELPAPAPAGGLPVTIASRDSTLVSASPASLVVPQDSTGAWFQLGGEGKTGYGYVNIQAPGYEVLEHEVYADRAYLQFSGMTSLTVGDTARVRVSSTVYACIQVCGYFPAPVRSAQTIQLNLSNASYALFDSIGTTPITSIVIEAGDSLSHEFIVVAQSGGGVSFTASNANFYEANWSQTVSYPSSATVSMVGTTFSPSATDVANNAYVYFDNQSGITHNVTWIPEGGEQPSNTGDIASGSPLFSVQTWSTTGLPKTYKYYCTYHGGYDPGTGQTSGMSGTVTVH